MNSIIRFFLIFFIYFPFKAISYSYNLSVSDIQSNGTILGSINVYSWNMSMDLFGDPDQLNEINELYTSDSAVGVVIYNISTGEPYTWVVYDGPYQHTDNITKPITVDRAILAFKNSQIPGTVNFNGAFLGSVDFANSCAQLAVISSSSDVLRTIEGGSCIPLPVPDVQCESDSGDILLDHGTLSPNSLNGNRVNKTINITCSQDVSVNITAISPTITLANGLESILYVNGQQLSGTIVSESGTSIPLEFSSVLQTSGTIEAGTYNGATVIVVTPN